MKKLVHAFFMAFGMFTAIPCPYRPWDDDARPLMILFLPVIGAVIGAIWMAAGLLAELLHLPKFLLAAVMALIPYLLTGFLHLDGYMDTSDAVLSRRDLEERRRILKDSHVGSFAVIMVVVLFLLSFAVFASRRDGADWHPLFFIPIAVRVCAAVAVSVLNPISTSQYSGGFREGVKARNIVVPLVMFAAAAAVGSVFIGLKVLWSMLIAAGGYWLAALWGVNSLKGMSGDISGFALTVGELAGAAAMILIGG